MLIICVVLLLIAWTTITPKIYYLSTKSTYPHLENFKFDTIFPPGFQTVYLRYLGRHGSRYASKWHMNKFEDLIKKLTEHSKHYEKYINTSRICIDGRVEHQLTSRGITELKSIGVRYRMRFPDVFNSTQYSANNFVFESTERQRTIYSMSAFMDGMFASSFSSLPRPQTTVLPAATDRLLRFFALCDHYEKMNDCLQTSYVEKGKFLKSKTMQITKEKINNLLKMDEGFYLESTEIEYLLLICAYDIIGNGGNLKNDVCKLFDNNDLIAADYMLDIQQYYQKANSELINLQMACVLFTSIYESISAALDQCNNDGSQEHPYTITGRFSFAHVETLIPILGSFGFFGGNENFIQNDLNQFINAENFHILKHNRLFKGGFFVPMGGNIMFAVACDKRINGSGILTVLLNEKLIQMPCCSGNIPYKGSVPVCSKKDFVKCFGPFTESCKNNQCNDTFNCPNSIG